MWPRLNTSQHVTPYDHCGIASVTPTPYSMCACCVSYHVCLLCEDTVHKTFQGHPSNGQFHTLPSIHLTLSEIVPGVDVLRQSKVCHLDHKVLVYPAKRNIKSKNGDAACVCACVHAVSSSQISVDKLLLCKVAHSLCNLETY